MAYLTLEETCRLTGATRRAIQGYEKAGLVSASGKNKRGGLLYGTEAQEIIRRIRLFQRLGFSIKEIQGLRDLPEDMFRIKLREKIEELLERKAEIDQLVQEVAHLIEE